MCIKIYEEAEIEVGRPPIGLSCWIINRIMLDFLQPLQSFRRRFECFIFFAEAESDLLVSQ